MQPNALDIMLNDMVEQVHELITKNQGSEITKVQVFEKIMAGIQGAIKKTGFGLWALSAQQERQLAVFAQAKAECPEGFELKLIRVPKRSDAILGPDGRPATAEAPKILLATK